MTMPLSGWDSAVRSMGRAYDVADEVEEEERRRAEERERDEP